jgi:serine/threonine protein phosphatase 1
MNRLFAISDIHGCFNTFHELVIKKIGLTSSDKLVLLGDYIDRGYHSREVIDFIIDLKQKNFNVVALAGNHEKMLVDAFNNRDLLPLWLLNSGMTTLDSFRISSLEDIDPKYYSFFTQLPFYEKVNNNYFVHAGFDDLADDPFFDTDGMIWHCRTEYSNPLFRGKRIIHGHRPKTISHVMKMISEGSDVIPIDTGCVYDEKVGYGNLSALEINSMELITIKRVDADNIT